MHEDGTELWQRFRKRVYCGMLIANSKSFIFSVARNCLLPWSAGKDYLKPTDV